MLLAQPPWLSTGRQGGDPGSNPASSTAACREGAVGGRERQCQDAGLQVRGPQWAARVLALSGRCWPGLYV